MFDFIATALASLMIMISSGERAWTETDPGLAHLEQAANVAFAAPTPVATATDAK